MDFSRSSVGVAAAATLIVAVLVAPLTGAGVAGAQTTSELSGRVTDRSTGRPIPKADIIVLATTRSATTDSAGRYLITGMLPGMYRMVVRAANFPALQLSIAITDVRRTDRSIVLDSTASGRLAAAQSLPPIGVTAEAYSVPLRLVDFERRRHTGRGQYLTEKEILQLNAYNLADAVKGLRGVTYECGGGLGCFIRMTRAPMRCLPEYIVDDHVQNDFGPHTPIRDIVGVEVYTGPSEVPGEYAGRNSGCGVVVIWTRAGPEKRPDPDKKKP
ncbi:MAG TPA: carboxypeptidase regulatory-like domain-containing protein [Gemmatimonadaceae bacterium]|nr:carboxypeptidase regulatory-like domain-containing protein [Gemmatimonadaceae bacterium]